MKAQAKLIKQVNTLLIKKFGVPFRNRNFPDPLDLLLATILSQNTNDNNSYKAFNNLKNYYKTWDELINEKRSAIEKIIRVAGLAMQKSAAIKNIITYLNEKNGEVNLNYIKKYSNEEVIEELTQHKGIGAKTASCVLLFALGRNVCPVDTHVHRTVNRLGIVKENTPDKSFHALNKNFPEGCAHSFHTNLIRLGREVCTPTKPNCTECPLVKVCAYPKKNFGERGNGKRRDFMLLDNVS
jgi:endonuclease III